MVTPDAAPAPDAGTIVAGAPDAGTIVAGAIPAEGGATVGP